TATGGRMDMTAATSRIGSRIADQRAPGPPAPVRRRHTWTARRPVPIATRPRPAARLAVLPNGARTATATPKAARTVPPARPNAVPKRTIRPYSSLRRDGHRRLFPAHVEAPPGPLPDYGQPPSI